MPIQKVEAQRRKGRMLESPSEIHFALPLSSEDRERCAAWLDGLVEGADLNEQLRRCRIVISARLAALKFPMELGRYIVSLGQPVEPGRPGSWKSIPLRMDHVEEAPLAQARHPCRITRHPALLPEHEQTEPWLLVKALDQLSRLEGHRSNGHVDEAIKSAMALGRLLTQAQLVANYEPVVAGPLAGREALADSNTAKADRAANRRAFLQKRADELWAADPNRPVKDVAGAIYMELPERDGKHFLEDEPVSESTIKNLVGKRKPARSKYTSPRARAQKK